MGPVELAQAELKALRDYARDFMLERAEGRLQRYDAADERRAMKAREHDLFIASAEAYGVLRNVELSVIDGREATSVEFSEKAISWLLSVGREPRESLDASRASIEITAERSIDAFLIFILDGIRAAQSSEVPKARSGYEGGREL
jgi:hypothetical protein